MENKSDKGEFGGSCNRFACQKPHAVWYNHSTRMYYCTMCARMINEANRTDAQRMFGHELCTYELYDRDKINVDLEK